jgi:hypothetical protein
MGVAKTSHLPANHDGMSSSMPGRSRLYETAAGFLNRHEDSQPSSIMERRLWEVATVWADFRHRIFLWGLFEELIGLQSNGDKGVSDSHEIGRRER